MYFGIIRHMKLVLQVMMFAGTLCAAVSLSGEANAPSAAASEVRTFRLQFASAREVAEQINQLMATRLDLCDRFDIMGSKALESK